MAVLGAILLALIGGGVALAAAAPGGTVEVPSLVGLTSESATDKVVAAGLTLRITERTADDPKGVVIGQHPAPGTFTGDDGEVELIVSRGPPPVDDPERERLSRPTTRRPTLERAGFVVNVKRQYDESVPVDAVIGTDPAGGTRAPRDSTLQLLVSDGPAPVAVPDVTGAASYEDAAKQLTDLGFTVARARRLQRHRRHRQDHRHRSTRGHRRDRAVRRSTVHVSKGPEKVPGAEPRRPEPREPRPPRCRRPASSSTPRATSRDASCGRRIPPRDDR